jgi:ABC-2 type transport system ATP-binding protein
MDKGTTILLTTQYLEEADQLADRIVLIDGGKVIAEGTAKELKSKVGKDRLVLSFKDEKTWQNAKQILAKVIDISDENELQHTALIGSDGSDVKKILESLESKKITISSMDIHKPTLDDVFLTLTKKPKKEEKEV